MPDLTFEKHYNVYELASVWGVSADTIRRAFRTEEGVIKLGHADLKGAGQRKGKRKYFSLRIPESVAARVHQRLGKLAA
jgi:hypothetical protein